MTPFTLRPGRLDDLEQVVLLMNLSSQQMIGADEYDMEIYRAAWTSPHIVLEEATRVAVSPDGTLLGVMEVWNHRPPYVRNWLLGRVHPDYEGLGVGKALMEWAEAYAHTQLHLAPPDTQVILRTGQFAVNTAAKALFESGGYQFVRHYFDMERVLDAPPEAPTVPDGMVIRPMRAPDEYAAIHRVDVEAFRDHWGHVPTTFENSFAEMMHFLREGGHHDPTLWFVAMDGEVMVGSVMCRLQAQSAPDAGWIESLAVRKASRKQGVGLALLLHAFGEFYKRGQRKAQLSVDAGSLTGALRLYERAGMKVFRQFDLYEKELRAGQTLMVRE